MIKSLTKKQKILLVTLTAVAVLLFLGLFLIPGISPFGEGATSCAAAPPVDNPGGTSSTPNRPHDRFRDARAAVDPNIIWENNFGGSGVDEIVSSFYFGDRIVIFGNTTSRDLDFAGGLGGWFRIVVGLDGRAISYNLHNGSLAQVLLLDNYFLLAINHTSNGQILKLDFEFSELRSRTIPLLNNERIIYIYHDPFARNRLPLVQNAEPYQAVVQITHPVDGYNELRIYFLQDDLTLANFNRHFSAPQSLDFLAIFPNRHSVELFVNLRGDRVSNLRIYSWTRASVDPPIDIYIGNFGTYRAVDIMPFGSEDGFIFLAINENNISQLVYRYRNFEEQRLHSLSNREVQSAKILMLRSEVLVYTRFYGFGSSLAKFADRLTHTANSPFSEFEHFTALYRHLILSNGTLIVGRTADEVVINRIGQSGVNFSQSFVSINEQIENAIFLDGSLILVGTSSAQGINVGSNFGQSDIWVTRVAI